MSGYSSSQQVEKNIPANPENNIHRHASTLVSRNITVRGRRTSVRLEPEMWAALRDIARRERCRIHDLCSLVQARKNPNTSLTAAIRVFLMLYYRAASTEEGHIRAEHGNFISMVHRARLTVEGLKEDIAPDRQLPEPIIPPNIIEKREGYVNL